MKTIATALSTHTACFICKEKNRKLKKVQNRDIMHAYNTHRIYIKHHARICDAHFDENGLIRKEEFYIIPTKNREFPEETLKMFDTLSNNYKGIFEQFRDINFLDSEHCKKITKWSKE